MILAAGGLLWRHAPGGAVEVAVVHRPRYDDWSLPKGKLAAGEAQVVGAAREVREETGYTPQVQRWLAATAYRVDGEPKHVDYWSMHCTDGDFVANDEVDRIQWLPAQQAGALLTRDRAVLDSFRTRPVDTTTILLIRHARAGNKRDWQGDDALRPLDETGMRQAASLVDVLTVFRPARILSADRARCIQTVQPLAAGLGLGVEIDSVLNEAEGGDPREAADRLRSLAVGGQPVAVCSQGGLIPETLTVLARESPVLLSSPRASKASAWALSFDRDGQLVGADYYPPVVAPETS
ncbi:MAG: NUDIX hydrolase [Pseudonocardiales bacterium]